MDFHGGRQHPHIPTSWHVELSPLAPLIIPVSFIQSMLAGWLGLVLDHSSNLSFGVSGTPQVLFIYPWPCPSTRYQIHKKWGQCPPQQAEWILSQVWNGLCRNLVQSLQAQLFNLCQKPPLGEALPASMKIHWLTDSRDMLVNLVHWVPSFLLTHWLLTVTSKWCHTKELGAHRDNQGCINC